MLIPLTPMLLRSHTMIHAAQLARAWGGKLVCRRQDRRFRLFALLEG